MKVYLDKYQTLNEISLQPFWSLCTVKSATGESQKTWFKILSELLALDLEFVRMYHDAAKQAIELTHPSILKTIESGIDNGVQYVAYEAFESKTLRQAYLQDRSFSIQRILYIINQIAQALQYAHLRGILHGALNPDNILIGQNDTIKVFNFCHSQISAYLAHELADEKCLRFVHFFSPEQAKKKIIDGRTDIYSLGVIFYQLLTGKLPFSASNLAQCLEACANAVPKHAVVINSKAPAEIDELVMRMMANDPGDRMQNISSLTKLIRPDRIGESELPAEDEYDSQSDRLRYPSIFKWLALRLPESFNLFSPMLVGSRRRLALAMMSVSIVLILIISILAFTSIGKKPKGDMSLYYDWIAEEEESTKNNDHFVPSAGARRSMEKLSVYERSKTRPRADGVATGNSKPQVQDQKSEASSAATIAGRKVPEASQSVDKKWPADQKKNFTGNPASSQQPAQITETIARAPTGDLKVFSNSEDKPISATVYVDGVLKGKTGTNGEYQIKQLSSRVPHTVRITKDGYRAWESTVRIPADSLMTVRAQLVALPPSGKRVTLGRVSFADLVVVNNKDQVFSLPVTVELAPGQHQLHYVHSTTGFSWDTLLLVTQNSPDVITFNASELGEGYLTVVIKNAADYGYAYVRLNDEPQPRGTTPIRIKVTAGPQQIKVSRDGFKVLPDDTTIAIYKGDEITLSFLLRPE